MADNKLYLRGPAYGADAAVKAYTGNTAVPGQLVWNTGTKHLHVMDGSTAGGWVLVMQGDLADFVTKTALDTALAGYVKTSTYTADKATFVTTTALDLKLNNYAKLDNMPADPTAAAILAAFQRFATENGIG